MTIEIETPDKLEYQFYPAGNGVFNFKIRAKNDAHVALTSSPYESDPMLEIFIGGWGNAKSVIRRSRTKPDKVEADTPDALSAGEFRGFWVRWNDGVVTVGREGEVAAFLSWSDPEPFPINNVGVCTGWGAVGSWIISEPEPASAPYTSAAPGGGSGGTPCWIAASDGNVPEDAVSGGQDGEPLYIARARHENALIPGKLVPSHGVCYVAWAGGEHAHSEYEVLCGCSAHWVPGTGTDIPPNAMPAGETEDGEPLFVGRANHEGTITVGKIQPSHGTCYIPYGGQELAFQDFEILITS